MYLSVGETRGVGEEAGGKEVKVGRMAAGGRSVAYCAAVLLAAALLLSAPTGTGSAPRLLLFLSVYVVLLVPRIRELGRSGARSPSRLMQRELGELR